MRSITQGWKRRRLSAIGVDLPVGVVYAPVDFEIQSSREGLQATVFDFSQPAVFSWITTAQFLTLDAINATLETVMHCPAGTRLVLTYNQPRSAVQGVLAEVSGAFVGIATEFGEPFLSRFLPHDIDALHRRHGFDETVDFGPENALTTYFGGRTEIEVGGAERIIAATVP